jgi:predicted molibdopterin-dependent oxidoreductase YjgC
MSDPSCSSNAKPLRSDRAVRRGPAVRFSADGETIEAFQGESVAAALLAAGCRELRRSPRAGAPRGMFCLMGSCQECLVWVGARKLPSCQVPVAEGLVVESLAFRERGFGE